MSQFLEQVRAKDDFRVRPTLDDALSDKSINERRLKLTGAQRERLEQILAPHDDVVRTLKKEYSEHKYSKALDRILSGNEVWVAGDRDTVRAVLDGLDPSTVIQTDLASRVLVNDWINGRFGRETFSLVGTGGAKVGTARYIVFSLGDGSGVMEIHRTYRQALAHREAAIRDYLRGL